MKGNIFQYASGYETPISFWFFMTKVIAQDNFVGKKKYLVKFQICFPVNILLSFYSLWFFYICLKQMNTQTLFKDNMGTQTA